MFEQYLAYFRRSVEVVCTGDQMVETVALLEILEIRIRTDTHQFLNLLGLEGILELHDLNQRHLVVLIADIELPAKLRQDNHEGDLLVQGSIQ